MPLPSLRSLHTQLRAGETTATALMQSCIDAYTATESQLQAYKTWNGESALKQAQAVDTLFQAGLDLGPLMGLPISAKDLFVVPPMPTFAGTTRPLEGWHQASPVIQSVQAQQGVVPKAHGGIRLWRHRTPIGAHRAVGRHRASYTRRLRLGPEYHWYRARRCWRGYRHRRVRPHTGISYRHHGP